MRAQTLAVLASMGAAVGVAAVVAALGTPAAGPSLASRVAAASPGADAAGGAEPAPPGEGALEVGLRTQDGRRTYRVGETVGIVLELTDSDGSAVDGTIDMGVGEPMTWPVADVACVQPAATYAAQPTRSRTTADAVYRTPGVYTITARVETANLCWPETARETKTVTMRIDVVA